MAVYCHLRKRISRGPASEKRGDPKATADAEHKIADAEIPPLLTRSVSPATSKPATKDRMKTEIKAGISRNEPQAFVGIHWHNETEPVVSATPQLSYAAVLASVENGIRAFPCDRSARPSRVSMTNPVRR